MSHLSAARVLTDSAWKIKLGIQAGSFGRAGSYAAADEKNVNRAGDDGGPT
jgi:hypothetical protein